MTGIPTNHIEDAHKLQADGVIELYEIVPAIGSGTFRFKNEADATWRGNLYAGLPVNFTNQEISAEHGIQPPKIMIGAPNLDLSMFKPLVHSGALDGGTLTKLRVLLTDLVEDNLIRETMVYQIRQVTGYVRNQITLQLALPSDGVGFTLPNRQYLPPDFPTVRLS